MTHIEVSNNNFIQLFLLLVLSRNTIANPIGQEKCALENEDCLKRVAQAVLPTFVQGFPELGIESLDVFHMDDLDIKAPTVQYEMRNTKITGFNDTIIDDLSVYLPSKIIRLNFHTTLLGKANYKADGAMFGIPVSGEGKTSVILQNLQIEMMILFDIVKNEQGKDIMDIKSYFYGSDALDGVFSYMENLYYGDKKKSDTFHKLLNQNWRTFVANFGRLFTSKVSGKIFKNIQKFMRSRPLEDLAKY